MSNHSVMLQSGRRWLYFSNPEAVIRASSVDEVFPALNRIESYLEDGYHAAGFLSYEASPTFDPSLITHASDGFPLLWFGIYEAPALLDTLPGIQTEIRMEPWQLNISKKAYAANILRIKEWLARGDTYQVNYTLRMYAGYSGDPFAYFHQLVLAQQAQYAACISMDQLTICSASPELFFRLDGGHLSSRPMKGTAPRGKIRKEDEQIRVSLEQSAKDRAENVMIVDMMRNDMGRIAVPGSVRVPELFAVEKYPTVWQMTSTVTSQTHAGFTEILSALFPCASITGAPKPHTMELITRLETTPRGIYTGAIGTIGPDRKAQFNVAIRTALFDHASGTAGYGVGGGIVWDSDSQNEFRECEIKSRVLTRKQPEFDLLESLLWTPSEGYFIPDYHLKRLRDSAVYFDYPMDTDPVRRKLESIVDRFPDEPLKVRLTLRRNGTIRITWEQVAKRDLPLPLKAALSAFPVNSEDIFLYHKTTYRAVYDAAKTQHLEADEVILINEQGEITEACASNVVLKNRDGYFTPPVSCGLLGGTFRAWLLNRGEIKEQVLTVADLKNADRIFLINSVRKWREAVLI